MMKPALVCGLIAALGAVWVSAEDFPLTFKTIAAKDVGAFPGASGTYASLRTSKPAALQKEPRAVSRYPLYGECRWAAAGSAFLFRLDESKGDGRGYDQLLVDLNDNGDLTDEAVAPRAVLSSDGATRSPNQYLFGPIQAPADKAVAGGIPLYFAQVYIFNRPTFSTGRIGQTLPSGQLILRPGWYLETTVELGGLKQKVGVLDGNSNLRLGDVSRPQEFSDSGERTWYFPTADSLLVDSDGSGSFENRPSQSEACPFGSILYLGTKAYKIALARDCTSLRVEPWTEALAELALRPHGEQVTSLTLACERPDRQWQLLRTAATNGRALVPPGNYRLYACTVVGAGGKPEQVMVSGMQRALKEPIRVSAGKVNSLDCGAPLEVKVTATEARTISRMLPGGSASDARLDPAPVLRINASVVGAGGEVYSTYLRGERFDSRPAKPSFEIVYAGGKTLASGSLEYG